METREQLYSVLDAIYNNLSQYDSYDSLAQYYNEMLRTAEIYEQEDEDDPTRDNILAIFNPERVVISSTEAYKASILKSSVGTEPHVYDFGIESYVTTFTFIKGACAFLGVQLADNFPDLQPLYFQQLSDITVNFFSGKLINNAVALLASSDDGQGGIKRQSFIPVLLLLEYAKFFDALGVFSVSDKDLLVPSVYYTIRNATNYAIQQYRLSDLYTTLNWTKYKKRILEYFEGDFTDSTEWAKAQETLDAFYLQFEEDLDIQNSFITVRLSRTTSGGNTTFINVLAFSMPMSACFYDSNGISGRSPRYIIAPEDFDYVDYTFRYKYSDNSYENSKSIGHVTANTIKDTDNTSFYPTNLNTNIRYKPYLESLTESTTSGRYYLVDGQIPPASGEFFKPKLNKYALHMMRTSSVDVAVKNSGVQLNPEEDLIVYATSSSPSQSFLLLFKAVDEIKLEGTGRDTYFDPGLGSASGPLYPYYARSASGSSTPTTFENHLINYCYARSVNQYITGTTIYFNKNITIQVYIHDTTNKTLTLYGTLSGQSFTWPTNMGNIRIRGCNLGEIYDAGGSTLEGLTLEEGAIYPDGVTTQAQLLNRYNTVDRKTASEPYLTLGEPTGNHSVQWIACTISKNQKTQAEAQAADLDDTSDIETVINGVDNAAEQSDEDPVQHTGNPSDQFNEGDTPDDFTVSQAPSALQIGLLKQYKMTTAEAQRFAERVERPDFQTAIVDQFLAEPLKAIVAFNGTYNGLWEEVGSVPDSTIDFNGTHGLPLRDASDPDPLTATRVVIPYKEIDLGTVDISPYFDNYLDTMATSIQIYLPFYGEINLDPADLLGGQVQLKARVDTISGTISYSVYAIRDGARQYLGSYDGVCQYEMPLTQDSKGQLIRGIIDSYKKTTSKLEKFDADSQKLPFGQYV